MSDKAYTHLHPGARPIAELDDDQRITSIKGQRWIEYPAATKVQDRIQDTFDQPKSHRMENILFTAKSGVGKTSLIYNLERKFNANKNLNPTYRPFVVTLMPHMPTEKAFFLSILRTLGVPQIKLSHLNGSHLQDEVSGLLHSSGTRMLVIDEINSMLVGTPRQQRSFLQLLRYLSNDLSMALVCVGTPEARNALRSDDQLRSRFSEVELPSWTLGPDLQNFINLMVQSMPLREPSPVDNVQIRKLLVERSEGVTVYICNAIRRAAVAAVRDGREMIDLDALRDSYSVVSGNPPYQRKATAPARNPAAPSA